MGNEVKKKILFITPDGLSTLIFAKSFNRDIDKNKYELMVASSSDNYKKEILSINLKHIEIKNFSRFFNIFKDIKFILELIKILYIYRPDYLVTFTTKPNIFTPLFAKLFRIKKVIMAVRGLGRMFGADNIKNKNLGYMIFKNLYKFSSQFSDYIWFTNSNDKNLFVKNGICVKKQIIQTKNAIDVRDFSLKNINSKIKLVLKKKYKKKSEKIILMVARLIKEKGVIEFAEAAKILKNKKPNFKFLLVAPIESNGLKKEKILEYEKVANFKWLGYQKHVRELYALCDLSVLPSYYSEGGYPRALLEAMSFSKPVITTNLPLCRGAVDHGKNGFLVKPKNSIDLSHKIIDIFISKKKYDQYCKYSRKKILKEFNDKTVVSKILSYMK